MDDRPLVDVQEVKVEDVEADEAPVSQTLNFMDVLKRSVENTGKGRAKARTFKKNERSSKLEEVVDHELLSMDELKTLFPSLADLIVPEL